MPFHRFVMFIMVMMLPVLSDAQEECNATKLSADQIHEIVVKARATRDDLPPAFPKYKFTVKNQGCYYVYIEFGLPTAVEYLQMFKLNRYGVIVDVQSSGGEPTKLKCPERVFTKNELTRIVKKEREQRKDFPILFMKYKIRVDRLSCLYLYYEYNLPERPGDYQVFIIDPYGELMEFSRSTPN